MVWGGEEQKVTHENTNASGAGRRKLAAERTRQDILSAAREEFAEHGLSGARVDAIAARTNTAKRMIYYYFGSKEGLYLAVLEAAYSDLHRSERELNLDQYSPAEAILRLVEFTFDYDEAHPDFIRLISAENTLFGRNVAQSTIIRQLDRDIVAALDRVLDRGRREGVFDQEVDTLDVHLLISSFCFFRVSNRYTFSALFDCDLSAPALRDHHKRLLCDAVMNMVARDATDRREMPGQPARQPAQILGAE
jgi:AcrR family transcriptional regulator